MSEAPMVVEYLQRAYELMQGRARNYPLYYQSQLDNLLHLLRGEIDPITTCEEGTQPLQAAE